MGLLPSSVLAFAFLAGVLAALFSFTQWQTRRIEALHPPKETFVLVKGGRLHLAERRPEGPVRATVVLLHGASGNHADMIVPLGDRLVGLGFQVISPDRPGHGWSDRPDGRSDANPARQAILIREGLESLGVRRAIMVGHSWAGALAVNFALDHADFTEGLVLLAPVTHPWPGGVAWYYQAAANRFLGSIFTDLFTLPAGLLRIDAAIASVFAPQKPPKAYADATSARLVLRSAEFMANAQDVADLEDFVKAQAPRMRTIAIPTAVVTGEHDRIVLTGIHSFGCQRDIPGATLKLLSGVGHSPHHSDPDAVTAAVAEVAERALGR